MSLPQHWGPIGHSASFAERTSEATQTLSLLYGMPYFPVYDPAQKMYTFALDAAHRNKMDDPTPKWGLSGFGNYFNAYVWSMAEYDDELYIGTFDWSYVLSQGLLAAALGPLVDPQFLADLYALQTQLTFPWFVWGADLYRIEGSLGPAIPVDVSGLGNFTNYGIRNMVTRSAPTGEILYAGTANPMNLLTDPASPLPMGGWELIKLTGTIEHHTVPTLNTWGFVLFSVVACLASLYHIRRRLRYQR